MSWGDVLFLTAMTGLVLWSAFGLGAWHQRNVDLRIIYRAMKDGHMNKTDAEVAMTIIRYGR